MVSPWPTSDSSTTPKVTTWSVSRPANAGGHAEHERERDGAAQAAPHEHVLPAERQAGAEQTARRAP